MMTNAEATMIAIYMYGLLLLFIVFMVGIGLLRDAIGYDGWYMRTLTSKSYKSEPEYQKVKYFKRDYKPFWR